jgi:hypothetical protein
MQLRSNKGIDKITAISELEDIIFNAVESQTSGKYEPTGLQEEIIVNFGQGNFEIILALHPNDVGKTTAGVQILKNIIWPHDPTWFSWWKGFSYFKDKVFNLKTFRIVAQHTNLIETGAIQTEINRWWPQKRFEWIKGGQHYPSQCVCDSGWIGDALSYNQSREEHESKKISILWADEPPPPDLIGAMTSRFSEGMLWLITATPIKCGTFLDIMKDMEDSGTKVKRLTGTAWENSIDPEKGKPNHLKTKYGLRTNEEITSKISRCPKDERDARIYGQASQKSGKIYPTFNRDVHVRYFDLGDPEVKKWNFYMSVDPHHNHYPFYQWWAYTPNGQHICVNEWPTFDTFGAFYDEVRNDYLCPFGPEDLSKFMKIFDGSEMGFINLERFLDPFYGLGAGSGTDAASLAAMYIQYGIAFTLPARNQIDLQRDVINNLLKYDPMVPTSEPSIFWMPHCVNSIRMMERHCWDDAGEKETQKYKEGSDTCKIYLAGFADRGYIEQKKQAVNIVSQYNEINERIKAMPNVSLG